MDKRNIFVKSIEERTSKASGKVFWTVDTSEGKMSVWDVEIEKEIKKATLPATLVLEVQEKGNFKNIVGITMDVSGTTPVPAQGIAPVPSKRVVCWEKKELSVIVEELNKLNTIATQFFPKEDLYDCVAWLR